MKQNIIERAKTLEESLRKARNKSSSLFEDIVNKVNSSTNDKELKEILEPLQSIGSISQYGDFTSDQDLLLEELLKEIKTTLINL